MSNKLSFWVIVTATWVVLLGYLTFDFIQKAPSQFFQLRFDWDKAETTATYDGVAIDSVSHDFLQLKKLEQFAGITNQKTYRLKNGKIDSYFRVTEIEETPVSLKLKGVRWLNTIPDKSTSQAAFSILELPLKQEGTKTVTTIGDSQLTWREARDFRKTLKNRNDQLVFKGLTKDVNAFPFLGGVFTRISEIKRLLPKIAPTEYYIVFFGAQDKATDKGQLQDDVCAIFDTLSGFSETKKILFVSLPPSSDSSVALYNQEFNAMASGCAKPHEKIMTIDLFELFKNENNYLLEDRIHLNEKGNRILTKKLATLLK